MRQIFSKIFKNNILLSGGNRPCSNENLNMLDYIQNNQLDKSNFVPLSGLHFKPQDGDPKVIAYYLPQFYEIEQNNQWFGKGFTEWTNCAKATPQFVGHHQPRIPIDVGFYNLETAHIMHRQAELARQYGIYGWCFYYYWFDGNRIMEKPINNFLADKSIDMPFCLFWANEDWSMTWGEGALGEKVYSAKIKPGAAERFVNDMEPFFRDERYIKVEDRPVLMIYMHYDADLPQFIKEVKSICLARGLAVPYVMLFNNNYDAKENFHPENFNADAAAEFAVHMPRYNFNLLPESRLPPMPNPKAKLKMYDMITYIEKKSYLYDVDYPLFKGAMTNFDNTARKIYTGAWTMLLSPEQYKTWLSDAIKWTRDNGHKENIVFVAAWNEWAEAMYLEPDTRMGYAYLEATRQAIEESRL